MTDRIKPLRHPSRVWIDTGSEKTVQIKNDEGEIEEFEIDDAILIDVNPIDMSTDISKPHKDLPENLRLAWKDAKRPSPSPEIIQALLDFTTEYMVEAQFDDSERNAYPAEVRKYVSDVEKTVAALQKLIDPNLDLNIKNHPPKDKRRQTIIRHMTKRAKGAFLLHDLADAAEAFRVMAIELRDSMAEPTRGPSGTKVPKARKELFASRLQEIFQMHDLPTDTSKDALLPVVLGRCLEAAGEKESQAPEAYFLTPSGTTKTD
ncbi:MAG: hypothetical protein C0429_17365 [Sphingopyxis sp.]|nr:hypothetical protein [Sphingopyxis sp.]